MNLVTHFEQKKFQMPKYMSRIFMFLFPFLFLLFTPLPMKTICTPIPTYCTISMCGDTEIRYPFSLQNTTHGATLDQEPYTCGYLGFGIVCTSSNTSILVSASNKESFLIKSINYSNYTATVVNYSDSGRGTKDEFLLVWGTSSSSFMECSKCEMTYGRCGYNNTSHDLFLCFCEDGSLTNGNCKGATKDHHLKKKAIEIVVPIVTILTCLIVLALCLYMKHSKAQPSIISNDDQKLEETIKQCGSNIPKRYTYSEITKMTNSFDDKIGQGGHGDVYKGYLFDGHVPIAVKLVKKNKFSGEQFLAEIASISTTSHVNVVSLLGFCLDGGNKCALIYEYMVNGSLEKHIQHPESSSLLGMDRRYYIALGVARGLAYLHTLRDNSMLHLDIKPQNILLDKDFSPKISDFGLAIFCNKRESILSKLQARGTVGYIAPELLDASVGIVSLSTDVYSFGMMVLEMVGARNYPTTTLTSVSNFSEAYFPDWVYKRVTGRHSKNQDPENKVGIDAIERKMILVGLWCIQINPLHRPTIEKVIEMFEGSIECIEVPPKPEFQFISAFGRVSVSNTMLSSTAGDYGKEHKIIVVDDVATRRIYNSGSYSCDLTLPR